MKKICSISPVNFDPFFGILNKFRETENSIQLHLDDKIWYSMMDPTKSVLVYSEIVGEVLEKMELNFELEKFIKISPKVACELYIKENKLVVKDEVSKHLIPILSDPNIKTTNPSILTKMIHKSQIELSKDTIDQVYRLMKLIEPSSDNRITLEVKDGKLLIYDTEQTECKDDFNEVPSGSDTRSYFSIDFISNAISKYKFYDCFKLSIGDNVPCLFEFKNDELTTKVFIAPRILDTD